MSPEMSHAANPFIAKVVAPPPSLHPRHPHSQMTTNQAPASRRELLGSKAINLSSKLLTRSANYLSSKNLDSLANPLNRVNQTVLKPSPSPFHHHTKRPSRDESWQEWDNDTSNWNMKVGGQPVPAEETSPSNSSSSRSLAYFHPQNWQKKPKESIYTEDHLVCFPGFVALQSPSYSRAGDIEVFISIHAFGAKPTLDQLNRSQRLIHSMICKMTGLPPLPVKQLTPSLEHNVQDAKLMEDDSDDEQRDHISQFKPRLPTPTHVPAASSPANLAQFNRTPSVPHLNTQLSTPPAKITYTAPTPVKSTPPSLPPRPDLSRSSSASSNKSSHRFFEHERPPSDSNSLLESNIERLNQQFSMENEDISMLHRNLKERLHSFFSQSAESSKVRLKLYGICSSKAANPDSKVKISLFRSRDEEPDLLTPELDPDEFIINDGRPLLTQVVTTRAGGVWEDKLVLPWQTIETHLSVNQMQTEPKLASTSRFVPQKASSQTGVIRLRIEAELINDEPPLDLCPKTSDPLLVNPSFKSDAAIRRFSIRKPALSLELDVIPALAESIHVISDIDDTIKHTNVLGGLKYMFQHVFLAGFDQVAIPGMAQWYQSLRELGCWIHYISNSPLELWYCIEGFLAKAGFPRGSVSLKEYARGATSILSGMWESAGSRKRARVEAIIKQFSNSRFICVGDSGEQDLEMYVSLAVSYPGRIISIYIRDVTTPMILGKEICIDQILPRSNNPRLPSFGIDGGQTKRASRFGMGVLATSKPCSPVGEAIVPTNGSLQRRSRSYDVSNLPHIEPWAQTASKIKPSVPPKPSHLSTQGSAHSNPVVDAPHIKRETNKSLSLGLDQPSAGGFSRPSSVYTPVETPSEYLTDGSNVTEKPSYSSHLSSNLDPHCLDDPKAQNLLDAFVSRVQKARSDLLVLSSPPPLQNGYFDPPLAPVNITKLVFFRNGNDLAVNQSILDTRNLLK